MKKSTLAAITVVSLVVAVSVAWLLVGRQPAPALGVPVALDRPLPSIVGPGLDGSTLDSASFRGRPTVINAWATWCVPCQQEQPALVRLATRYGSSVRFVGINYRDDDLAGAKSWLVKYHVPYPSYYDPSGRSAQLLKFPLTGIPITFVVDGAGVIRWALYGELGEQELAGAIDKVLAAAPSATPSP
jgi:thiol-disulfide isomerase/thioredoxin